MGVNFKKFALSLFALKFCFFDIFAKYYYMYKESNNTSAILHNFEKIPHRLLCENTASSDKHYSIALNL